MENQRIKRLDEKLLVLAKASPTISRKYDHLVCVAGITDKGEWRRIYPIPWENFIGGGFKKKSWIEYELPSDNPADHRKESRKVIPYFTLLNEASFKEIKELLDNKLTTLEALYEIRRTETSLGVIKPFEIIDFVQENNPHFANLKEKQQQQSLEGGSVIKIFIPKKAFSYIFKCSKDCPKQHKITCEDWELTELYRHCLEYMEDGKYKDEREVFEKVKQRFFVELPQKKDLYFVVGTHFIQPTYIIVGVIYPKKADVY